MVLSNRGRNNGRDTRRAVGSWSHQLNSRRGFSRIAVLRGQMEPSIPRGRVVEAGSAGVVRDRDAVRAVRELRSRGGGLRWSA